VIGERLSFNAKDHSTKTIENTTPESRTVLVTAIARSVSHSRDALRQRSASTSPILDRTSPPIRGDASLLYLIQRWLLLTVEFHSKNNYFSAIILELFPPPNRPTIALDRT
jgi:hypothetical protein